MIYGMLSQLLPLLIIGNIAGLKIPFATARWSPCMRAPRPRMRMNIEWVGHTAFVTHSTPCTDACGLYGPLSISAVRHAAAA